MKKRYTLQGGGLLGGTLLVAGGVGRDMFGAFIPYVVSDWVIVAGVILGGLLLVTVITWRGWEFYRARRAALEEEAERVRELEVLHTRKGIVEVVSDRARLERYPKLWNKEAKVIYCFGVGMSNVTADSQLIENAVARGTKVRFEMMDPHWLKANLILGEQVDMHYGRSDFPNQMLCNLKRLVALRDRLNERYGKDMVVIIVYQMLYFHSGTIVNPGKPDSWGWTEAHQLNWPHGQTMMKSRMYEAPESVTEPPHLVSVLGAREKLPRFIVGVEPEDREEIREVLG